jgi:hypothetical protein
VGKDPDEVPRMVLALYQGHWQLLDPVLPAGSVVLRADCGHLSLVSPQGQAALAIGAYHTMCDTCHFASPLPGAKTSMLPGSVEAAFTQVPASLHHLIRQNMRRFGIASDENGPT